MYSSSHAKTFPHPGAVIRGAATAGSATHLVRLMGPHKLTHHIVNARSSPGEPPGCHAGKPRRRCVHHSSADPTVHNGPCCRAAEDNEEEISDLNGRVVFLGASQVSCFFCFNVSSALILPRDRHGEQRVVFLGASQVSCFFCFNFAPDRHGEHGVRRARKNKEECATNHMLHELD
jgi:hypothetical protein